MQKEVRTQTVKGRCHCQGLQELVENLSVPDNEAPMGGAMSSASGRGTRKLKTKSDSGSSLSGTGHVFA